jgi:hypothetical protein
MALFSAAAAVVLLFLSMVPAGGDEPGSIHLLFTGGVTAHLEPSG